MEVVNHLFHFASRVQACCDDDLQEEAWNSPPAATSRSSKAVPSQRLNGHRAPAGGTGAGTSGRCSILGWAGAAAWQKP
jgi:hypothetical protein